MKKRRRLLVALSAFASAYLFICLITPAQMIEVEFLNEACIKPHHGYYYQTCEDINVLVDNEPVIIPEQMNTDLASIPKWLYSFIAPSYSAFVAPAILHDYLYKCPYYDRKTTDLIFYNALMTQNAGPYSSLMMFWAVRIFGAPFYERGNLCAKSAPNDFDVMELEDLAKIHAWDHNDLREDERILDDAKTYNA